MDTNNFEVMTNADAIAHQAADWFVVWAQKSIEARGKFSVALSGGSTPRKLYELLANENESYRGQIDWQNVHFFFGDERHVAPNHDESNFKMTNDALFSKIHELPEANIHRVLTENHAADAASLYEETLREFFQSETVEFPVFDLILLGLGADGHTASLFPESAALNEGLRFFVENYVEKFAAYRLTLTFPVINRARNVLFLIAGADKAEIVRRVLQPESAEIEFPAQLVNPADGKLFWLFDEAAGRELSNNLNG